MTRRTLIRTGIACLAAVFLLWPACAEPTSYTVKKGDTLYGIARAHQVDVAALRAANKLAPDAAIKVGQKLVIPVSAAAPSPNPPAETTTTLKDYTVKKGDTWFGIARSVGIEVSKLAALNKVSSTSTLKVGQVIKIPAPVETVAVAPSPSPSPSPSPVASAKPSPPPPATPPTNGDDASSGTILRTKPYTAGANLAWPHAGERFEAEGKLPGLLIRAKVGDAVTSVSSGLIIYSEPHNTLGHIVIVQSTAGFLYIYGGNSGSTLLVGNHVKKGDPIGQVGSAVAFPEPQVYFSTWKDGTYIDPAVAPRD